MGDARKQKQRQRAGKRHQADGRRHRYRSHGRGDDRSPDEGEFVAGRGDTERTRQLIRCHHVIADGAQQPEDCSVDRTGKGCSDHEDDQRRSGCYGDSQNNECQGAKGGQPTDVGRHGKAPAGGRDRPAPRTCATTDAMIIKAPPLACRAPAMQARRGWAPSTGESPNRGSRQPNGSAHEGYRRVSALRSSRRRRDPRSARYSAAALTTGAAGNSMRSSVRQ